MRRTLISLGCSFVMAAGLAGCGGGGGGGGADSNAVASGVSVTPAFRSVLVSWSPVSGASTYHVFLAASSDVAPGNYLSLPEGRHVPGVPRTSCTIAGLTEGTTYWAVVCVEHGANDGPPSAAVSATLAPGAVETIFAQPLNGQLKLNWINVSGASTYDVYTAK